MADVFLTEPYLEKFEQKFSNKKTVHLPGVGHFPQEEYSELDNLIISEIDNK
jgi:pimeloyl-ACP methyl ester carboxylesterase